MDKKALRNKRLDELDEEEGLLDTNRFHGGGERGEMLEDPETLFEDEDEDLIADKSLKESKKDKMRKRLDMIKRVHQDIKERQRAGETPVEESPVDLSPAVTMPSDPVVDEETAFEDEEEDDEPVLMEEQVEFDSEGRPIPPRPNTRADEFDKNVLPLEEIRALAPAYGEDYGYPDVEVDEKGKYLTYVLPAPAKIRSDLKALLIRINETTPIGNLKNELQEVDTLNDLEARHALNYYKKIDILERKKSQKAQTLRENEADEE